MLARSIARTLCGTHCVCPGFSGCRRGQPGRARVTREVKNGDRAVRKRAEKARSAYEARDTKDHYGGLVAMRLEEDLRRAEEGVQSLKRERARLEEDRGLLVGSIVGMAGEAVGAREDVEEENARLRARVSELEADLEDGRREIGEVGRGEEDGGNVLDFRGEEGLFGGGGNGVDGEFGGIFEDDCPKVFEDDDGVNSKIWGWDTRRLVDRDTSAGAPAS